MENVKAAGIRPAVKADASRIAEILVFNNRVNYWPIFRISPTRLGRCRWCR